MKQREDNGNVTQSPWLQEIWGNWASEQRITMGDTKNFKIVHVF